MMNRRKFIKTTLSAGLVLGSGSLVNGCSGLKRGDLPVFQKVKGHGSMLDTTSKSILYYAGMAPSGHNSQPWRVRIETPGVWIIEADHDSELPAVDPENRELMLSLGAFVENLSLAAGAMGWTAHMQIVAQTRRDRDVVRVTFHKGKPTLYPLKRIVQRRTVKHGQQPRELSASDVEALSLQTRGDLFYFPKGSEHAACIREAAVENFRIQTARDEAQKELVQWLRLSDRDALRHRDGLSTEGMEIGGFKGWFVRHFLKPEDFLKAANRRQGVALTAELAHQGGGWLVLTSPGETVADLIETGRRFERMALLARERGIGIHPMTQILEEKAGLSQIVRHHGNSFFPQFILRVGYVEKYPEPVSLRRPVEWFVHT